MKYILLNPILNEENSENAIYYYDILLKNYNRSEYIDSESGNVIYLAEFDKLDNAIREQGYVFEACGEMLEIHEYVDGKMRKLVEELPLLGIS